VGDAHAKPGLRTLPLGKTSYGFGDIPWYQILHDIGDPDYYVARYDGEIRYADDALGAFIERLRALDLYDRTLMVVTADHGETLDEPTHHRYFGHEFVAYEEDARIPLIVHEPAGHRRLAAVDPGTAVPSIDVAPTILDLLGVEVPAEFEGRSLLRATRAAEEPIFTLGAYGSARVEHSVGTQRAVLRGPWRYVFNTLDRTEELYDHREDPQEARNLALALPDQTADLRRVLDDFMALPGRHNRASEPIDAELQRLRALGYLP
jgi:arylsulfatase A-like enzyme